MTKTSKTKGVRESKSEEQFEAEVEEHAPKGVISGIKPLEVGTMKVTISGISPLIVHAWSKKALTQMLTAQQMTKEEKRRAKDKREAKDPDAEFEGARYRVDGKDSFPTVGVKKAMVDAGYVLGYSRAVIRQAVFIVGDVFTIEHEDIVKREDTVRVGPFGNRQADLRYRPEYRGWSANLTFRYRKDMITADQVLALLQNAGFSVGIGEWRPQKDGQFGQFEVTAHEVVG